VEPGACAAHQFIIRGRRVFAAQQRYSSHTTLVLVIFQPDFSTDAANSVLIAQLNLRTCHALSVSPCRSDGVKKSKNSILAHQEGMPCFGGSFLDDNL
jgi:hypothetical protein